LVTRSWQRFGDERIQAGSKSVAKKARREEGFQLQLFASKPVLFGYILSKIDIFDIDIFRNTLLHKAREVYANKRFINNGYSPEVVEKFAGDTVTQIPVI